jgi:hypothetical protein
LAFEDLNAASIVASAAKSSIKAKTAVNGIEALSSQLQARDAVQAA